MSPLSWKDSLQKKIELLRQIHSCPRIALIGIGQELCGDDAVGILTARTLRKQDGLMQNLLVIDAGPAPENFCGALRRFQPHLVIFIDAAQMHGDPGLISYLNPHETTSMGISTHSLPLFLFADYLTSELGCETGILGIQPENIVFGAPLTSAVRKAVTSLLEHMTELLSSSAGRQTSVVKEGSKQHLLNTYLSQNAQAGIQNVYHNEGAHGK